LSSFRNALSRIGPADGEELGHAAGYNGQKSHINGATNKRGVCAMGQGRRAAILTVSDGVFHGTRTDDSGRALAELLTRSGFEIAETAVVADEVPEIEAAVRRMAAAANLVVTTGGTGFGPRDVTPEATGAVLTRDAPGLAETMRAVGRQVSPMAIIPRRLTGTVGDARVLDRVGSPHRTAAHPHPSPG